MNNLKNVWKQSKAAVEDGLPSHIAEDEYNKPGDDISCIPVKNRKSFYPFFSKIISTHIANQCVGMKVVIDPFCGAEENIIQLIKQYIIINTFPNQVIIE
jgi:hypothetical protein